MRISDWSSDVCSSDLAGIKFEPARGSLVTASVYQITQTNIATPDQAHPGFFIQQGEVRSRGVEVEARVAVTENFNLTLAYAYTDARTTKANPTATGDRKSTRLNSSH